MPYPSNSDFLSTGARDAWWVSRHANDDGTYFWTRCETSGHVFARYVQDLLKKELPSTGLRTYDGTIISPSDLAVDGVWGTKTFKALWALLRFKNADTAALNQLQRDAAVQNLTLNTISGALWLMDHSKFGTEFGDVSESQLPENAIPFFFASDPPEPLPTSPIPIQDFFLCIQDDALGNDATPLTGLAPRTVGLGTFIRFPSKQDEITTTNQTPGTTLAAPSWYQAHKQSVLLGTGVVLGTFAILGVSYVLWPKNKKRSKG